MSLKTPLAPPPHIIFGYCLVVVALHYSNTQNVCCKIMLIIGRTIFSLKFNISRSLYPSGTRSVHHLICVYFEALWKPNVSRICLMLLVLLFFAVHLLVYFFSYVKDWCNTNCVGFNILVGCSFVVVRWHRHEDIR